VSVTIRPLALDDERGVDAYLRIRNAAQPDNPDSADHLAWEHATYPGQFAMLLAEDPDGTVIGAATCGRIYMLAPEYERSWLGAWVVPERRRQGVGSALLAAAGVAARELGKTGFEIELSEAHQAGMAFLAAHGFLEVERSKAVALTLAGRVAPAVDPPPGITITTLAERPDLLEGVHQTAVEAFPDIPTSDEPMDASTLEGFTARDVDRTGMRREAFFVAVDEASGEAVGYASLMFAPGSSTIAWHDMTATRPAFRGRGIAKVLKRATIVWAIDNGVETLETGNDEANGPMRAVNLALGYEPQPDYVSLQGPLPPAG
jgi:GNAT superfamily N-acetyltransferase